MIDLILHWDKTLFLALNFDGGAVLDRFFWVVSGRLTWVPLYVLIITLLWRRYGWREALLAVVFIAVMVGAVDQACNFFKATAGKLRPSHSPDLEGLVHLVKRPSTGGLYRGGLYGAVSAHAATTFAIMTFSSALVRARWFTVLTVIWTTLVAYSRIYLGVHYPLDILLGALLGILAGVLFVKLYQLTTSRLQRRISS
ncbi:MAG: phosphatase PAP2 family protein [Rikenellaceae bacterium]|nr:phosphatase PAP2 family protein [Rikenellaceae bacterium]MCL2692295.1 phosphatase PAP2 family protein [Rikenellaceae bacterium]